MTTTQTQPAKKSSPTSKRRTRRIALAALGLAILGFVVYAFLPDPVSVDAVAVRRGALRVTVDEDGVTRVKDRYVVSAPLSGSLTRIELVAGDTVQEGDVIARILPSAAPLLDARSRAELAARVSATSASILQAESAVDRARTAAQLAESELARGRALVASGASTAQQAERLASDLEARRDELSSAEFGVRVARHEQSMARAASGDVPTRATSDAPFEVRSPVAGRVLRVFRTSDGPVAPGTQLVEVGDPGALEIAVDVLTNDAIAIHPGARVVIDRWGGADELEGRVRLVEPSAFTRTSALGVEEQRVNVVIDLVTNRERWRALGDGYRVEAAIVVDEVERALLVPELATFRADSGVVAFEIVDGVARRRSLTVGRRNGIDVEVVRGLREGSRVILHPSERISDGSKVRSR